MDSKGEWIPFGNRVKIRPDEAPDRVGMIELPKTAQKVPTTGTVLAVGSPESWDDTPPEPGDRVLYTKYGGIVQKENGEDVVILDEKDLRGIWREA